MNIKLEILTPINIGSGEVLSPYTDYIYDKGYVYYIDHDSLFWELNQKSDSQKLVDDFVKIVRSQAKGSSKDKYKLKSFLEGAGLDYKKHSYKKLPAYEEIREQIQLHVKSAGQPYIPGSSLKGAIRTVLLAYLISLGNDSEIISYINKEKKPRHFKYIGQNFFGKFGDDIFKYFQVSDTMPFKQEDLKIVKFYRYHLKNKKQDIPVVKEIISKGSVSTFNIKINVKNLKNSIKKEEISRKLALLYEKKEEALFELINEYTRKNVAAELEHLRRFKSELTEEIKQFYQTLMKSITDAEKTKEAYLRIGSGKTYYDNTIAQKLFSDTVKQIIAQNFKKANPNIFPITRTIVIDGAKRETPGWIKISKV